MKEFWLYGAIAAALSSPPAHLKREVEMMDGGGHYSTQIVPVVLGDRQYAQMGFCYITGFSPGQERWLTAPFATVTVAYPDKRVVWRDTKPIDFGLSPTRHPGDPTEYMGLVEREGLTMLEFDNAERRYPELISKVMERRWLLTQHSVTVEERATARELHDCVRVLYDEPLLPYYQHIGRHFFAWMKRAAK